MDILDILDNPGILDIPDVLDIPDILNIPRTPHILYMTDIFDIYYTPDSLDTWYPKYA